MRGPAARFLGIALAAAVTAAAASASAAPASSGYDEGLAAYQRNDFEKSLKLLRPLAEKGDARAQYLVGRQYQFGQAVKADRAEAFYWYKRAEAKGHQEAKLFRLLLEKRWKITAGEKGRAERKIAAANAPKPAPSVAQIESRPKPAPSAAERAKPAPAKPAVEAARARLPEPPKAETAKAKPEPVKAKAPDKPAIAAARTTVPDETMSPAVPRGAKETARATPIPPARGDDDDEDSPAPRRYESPPPESRTTVAAVPNMPPPRDDDAPDYPPNYGPSARSYTPPPASYAPPPNYYAHGPAPYYAPAAPPTWRATIHYGPSAYYPRHWGYRPYTGYVHPGWRGMGWRGHRGRW